ncbi:MAG TPA: DHH family phosphoesterase [Lachnospiraceae bacterium]|nr:DHH family phosphoesterase [Lachnospiraceae bacterium]
MTLRDLEQFNQITIQCHDNPDADSLGSGYGLYCYFTGKGISTRLVYSGRNKIQKSNLCLMVEKLKIPIEYIKSNKKERLHLDGLLITVDCQYGAGNVTGLIADEVAIIDHHQVEIDDVPLSIIMPKLGSCSTLVWKLMKQAGYQINDENGLGTALYYGLYTDTNQFSELYNPLDMDMREAVPYDKSLITLFKNSNLSLKELEIAGIALIRYSYNDDYEFAVIKAQPCDPNILGLISDFLLQVDIIKTCVVFNQVNDGYKLSVRSCVREVNASELASYLTEGIGSGGGHYEKAGGFISMRLYEEKYPTLHAEGYFNNRMTQYFDNYEIIYAKDYQVDLTQMRKYEKRKIPVGYVKADEILPVGTPITIRTLEGDIELTVEEDLFILIGIKGEVYPKRREKFEQSYLKLSKKYCIEECAIKADYVPTIKSKVDDKTLVLTDYAKVCIPTGEVKICAKPLERGVKIFTAWDKEKYMLGRPGDYLAVRCDDLHDIYVVEKDIFARSYDETVHL